MPHIATVFDLDTHEVVDFLVMESVPGDPPAACIARGAAPDARGRPLGVQIARALEAAHEQGIVHRDLKPARIVLAPRGRVRVLDSGLAQRVRPVAGTEPGRSLADAAVTVGTVPSIPCERPTARRGILRPPVRGDRTLGGPPQRSSVPAGIGEGPAT